METLLIIAGIGWAVVGLNLLFTYDKTPAADLEHRH